MALKSTKKNEAAETKNPPAAKIRVGLITASIWQNENDKGTFHNVTFERRYKDAEGKWQTSHSYNTGDLLDGVISTRAAAHGFTFVDPRNAFLPHEVCSSSEWLNGQSNPLSESYHPNISGYANFTSEIEAVLP